MTAASSVVDLSRLPAPSIVDLLTFDQIVAAMTGDLQARFPEYDAIVASDPGIKIIQVAAYREQLLRQAFQDAAVQLFVAYATGAALDHLAALVGVTRLTIMPADATTGTAAVMESDDALRQRVVLAPETFSVAGPELAYVARAKAADGRVLDASAISPAPGQVLVSVLSTDGDGTASADLLAAVTAAVTDKAVRPLGDQVTVASAVIVPYVITAALTTFSGPDVTIVLDAASAALDTYLTTNRLLGRDHTLSGLYAALTVAGVEDVTLTSPPATIACDPTQAAHATTVGLTHAGYAA